MAYRFDTYDSERAQELEDELDKRISREGGLRDQREPVLLRAGGTVRLDLASKKRGDA